MTTEVKKIVRFIKLLDTFKFIKRKIYLNDKNRLENDAEHSWHVAMMVWLFSGYLGKKINSERAIKMALMHDLVEIYAGDTFAYDSSGRIGKADREKKAAKKLFSKLPQESKKEFEEIWKEVEDKKTPEAGLVQAMDKLQPILQNILVRGKNHQKFKVTEQMIRAEKSRHFMGNDLLKELFEETLKENSRINSLNK